MTQQSWWVCWHFSIEVAYSLLPPQDEREGNHCNLWSLPWLRGYEGGCFGKKSTFLFPRSRRQFIALYLARNLMTRRGLNLYKNLQNFAIKLTYILLMVIFSLVKLSPAKQELVLPSPFLHRNKKVIAMVYRQGLFFPWHLHVILINGSGSFVCAQRGKLDPQSHHVAVS